MTTENAPEGAVDVLAGVPGWPSLGCTITDTAAWLNACNGTSREEIGLRVLKVAEEAGEVAGAWIGYVGQNPRKGTTHTAQDVTAELADVAFAALVAIASLGHDPMFLIAGCATKVHGRINGGGSDIADGARQEVAR